ncbi:MAG: hypothetical protein K5655_06915 [Lachnospiraceae bacterium]|nr:hypothetical protein [Lachnospiraceae bacterium]
MYREDNVVNLRGRQGNPSGRPAESGFEGSENRRMPAGKKKRKKKFSSSVLGALILFAIMIYLIFAIFVGFEKEKLSIYEVRAAQLSYDTTFKGIAIRDEKLVYADNSGYVSYFIRNKKKTAKDSIIYCVDSSSNTYNALKKNFIKDKLDKTQIKEIKSSMARYLEGDSSTIIGNIGEFKDQLSSMIYDFVSNNMIENLKDYVAEGLSGSSFHVFRSPNSGVISFKCDQYTGITSDMVTADMFENAPDIINLRSTGLISSADPVYRICEDENWTIVCKVTEDFYVDNVATREAMVFIGNKTTPVNVTTTPYSIGEDYFIEIKLNTYMSEFIDDRLLSVRFINDRDAGLKIPVSSIVQKDYYLVPLDMFTEDKARNVMYLNKETTDQKTGEVYYSPVYPAKYYSDGFYAYIDPLYVTEGDILLGPDNETRMMVSNVNSLDGVYNVNKGSFQFVRIERLETGSDYIVISPSTPDGIREYDHIALDGSKGEENDLINES